MLALVHWSTKPPGPATPSHLTLNVSLLDHSGPAIEILLDEGRELFRRAAHDLHAEFDKLSFTFALASAWTVASCSLATTRGSMPGWSGEARDVEDLEVLHARFCEGWRVGKVGMRLADVTASALTVPPSTCGTDVLA